MDRLTTNFLRQNRGIPILSAATACGRQADACPIELGTASSPGAGLDLQIKPITSPEKGMSSSMLSSWLLSRLLYTMFTQGLPGRVLSYARTAADTDSPRMSTRHTVGKQAFTNSDRFPTLALAVASWKLAVGSNHLK
ncbi:unnamed protein product [Polarella glacialis]|uniref:Uncharacterized protein n=1 Tax=Polarella glacialis TaxID=89957 RepID=A0A813LBM1_POLGL|nr:unnamed protein product [Polarella glacialis]